MIDEKSGRRGEKQIGREEESGGGGGPPPRRPGQPALLLEAAFAHRLPVPLHTEPCNVSPLSALSLHNTGIPADAHLPAPRRPTSSAPTSSPAKPPPPPRPSMRG
jgi:hypothetical protein